MLFVATALMTLAQAASITDPSGLFAFTVPGDEAAWPRTQLEADVHTWQSGEVSVVSAKTDLPASATADTLVSMVKESEQDFPQATAFANLTVTALGAKRTAIAFECQPRGQHRLVQAVAFPANGACWVVVAAGTVGRTEPATLTAILNSIVKPAARPAPRFDPALLGAPAATTTAAPRLGLAVQRNGGKSAAGLPQGWQVRSVEGGGLQAYETVANGAWLDMQVVPWQRGAAQLLHDGFAAPQFGLVVDKILRSRDDRTCQITYHSPLENRKGEAFAMLGDDGTALFTRFVADQSVYAAKRDQLSQVMRAVTQGAPAAGAGAGAPVPPLTRANTPDGTAWISAPAGWKVTGSNGILEGKGAHSSVALGGNGIVFTPASAQLFAQAGQPLPPLVSDYLPPEQALPMIVAQTARFLGQPVSDMVLVKSQPLPAQPGMCLSQITYRGSINGGPAVPLTTVGMVTTQPMGDRWWFYASMVTAETERMAQEWPTLMAVWNSFEVSPALQAKRIKATQESLDAITAIIQDVTINRARVASIGNEKWDAYIRGQTPMIDRNTGKAKLVGEGDLEKWKQENPNGDLQPMAQADWQNAKW